LLVVDEGGGGQYKNTYSLLFDRFTGKCNHFGKKYKLLTPGVGTTVETNHPPLLCTGRGDRWVGRDEGVRPHQGVQGRSLQFS